jgi:hypothetical protein
MLTNIFSFTASLAFIISKCFVRAENIIMIIEALRTGTRTPVRTIQIEPSDWITQYGPGDITAVGLR